MTTKLPLRAATSAGDIDYRAMFEECVLGMGRIRLADARWVDVNRALCQMVWRSRDELLAMSWQDFTLPEDIGLDVAQFQRLVDGDIQSYTVEKRLLHANGTGTWARLTLSLAHDAQGQVGYALVIVEDIRDRKDAEHALAESSRQLEAERARLQAIIDTIPTGLIMLDDAGAMALENAEWKRTWAGNALLNSVVDYDSYKGFRPDTGERIAAEEWPCAISLKQGIQTRDVILDIERFNGTRGTIVVSSAPIRDPSGRVVGAVAANMDISALRAAQARLIEADRRKDEFLAMLGHELRNPLAPIASAAEMLRIFANGDPKIAKASEVISRQTRHLSALVNDLLDVSRVTKGLVELRKEVVDIGTIIESAVEQSRPQLDHKMHRLVVHDDGSNPVVMGDRNCLVQGIVNLLNNAAKYTPEAGHIMLSIRTEGERVLVEVEDSGIGIDARLLPQVFELFTQAERTPDRAQGGLGIGLALVKTIVNLHGGEITAHSPGLGCGSTFKLSLPLLSEPEPLRC